MAYDKLSYGDVVWCEVEKSEKYSFEGRHKVRPFTVMYTDGGYIYALAHTHSRNIGILGYYVDDTFKSIITGEIIKIDRNKILGMFNKKYTSDKLNEISRYIYPLFKNDESVSEFIRSNITIKCGDLVESDNEEYLVKKISSNKASLIKLASKTKRELTFRYNGTTFRVLKDAIVMDLSSLKFKKEYGEGVFIPFEKTKKQRQYSINKNTNEKDYKVGNILLIDDEEKVIIDIYDDYLIVVDTNNKCACYSRKERYDILDERVNESFVKELKKRIDYDDIKRKNILLLNKNRK